jgi:hypothetical protein
MEEFVDLLKAHFTKIDDVEPEDDTNDEMLIEGDYWEFTNPKEVEAWCLKLIPHTDNMHFNMKYRKTDVYLPISFDERVKRLSEDKYPDIKVHCVTTKNEFAADKQYHFTLVINTDKMYFNISPLLQSMEPTPYSAELKQLEQKVDDGYYQNLDGTPLTGRRLITKLTLLMTSFEVFKEKHSMQRSFLAARTVSVDNTSLEEGQPSTGRKTGGSQSRGTRSKKPPPSSTSASRKSPLALASTQKPAVPASEQSGVDSLSYMDDLIAVPEALRTDRKPDYRVISAMYKNFWETYSSAYIFGSGEKKDVHIDNLIDAPATFNIRVKEDTIVKEMLHYLVNMPDKTIKQTLCVMPVMPHGNKDPPKNWEEVMGGKFYIINGQHSVAASKLMMEEESGVSDQVQKHFKTWKCFVVWSSDPGTLRHISAYYNRTNHFQPAPPSWATNILGARTVWIAMGRPKHPKGDGTGGPLVRNKETIIITQKFRVSNSGGTALKCMHLITFIQHFMLLSCSFDNS